MVKEEIEEIQSGNGRYFFSYQSYQILRDPISNNTFTVTALIPVKQFAIDRPNLKQLIPIHPEVKKKPVFKNEEENFLRALKEHEGESNIFHHKSQGITIFCENIRIEEDRNLLELNINDYYKEGIIDGSHIYECIKNTPAVDLPKKCYIKLEIIVGLHNRHAEDIIKAKNTKIRKDNKATLTKTDIEWIDSAIKDTGYEKILDHATVLSLINLFRNNKYDSEIDEQPTNSYSDKNMIVEDYQKNKDEYKIFSEILKDILYLYDYTNVVGQELWSEKKGTLGSSGISLPYKQKYYQFPMMKKNLDYKFHDAVTYALLNGLRMYVIFIEGKAKWSKDFNKILETYKNLIPELIKIARDHNKQIGYNVHLLGKSKLLYSIIYKELLMGDLLNQFQ